MLIVKTELIDVAEEKQLWGERIPATFLRYLRGQLSWCRTRPAYAVAG
jgi:hypothetical protein